MRVHGQYDWMPPFFFSGPSLPTRARSPLLRHDCQALIMCWRGLRAAWPCLALSSVGGSDEGIVCGPYGPCSVPSFFLWPTRRQEAFRCRPSSTASADGRLRAFRGSPAPHCASWAHPGPAVPLARLWRAHGHLHSGALYPTSNQPNHRLRTVAVMKEQGPYPIARSSKPSIRSDLRPENGSPQPQH